MAQSGRLERLWLEELCPFTNSFSIGLFIILYFLHCHFKSDTNTKQADIIEKRKLFSSEPAKWLCCCCLICCLHGDKMGLWSTCQCFLNFLRNNILFQEFFQLFRNFSFDKLCSGGECILSVIKLWECE